MAITAAAVAVVHANQASYNMGGLEQGWTVAARPAGDGPLLLSFGQTGRLRGQLASNGQSLEIRDPAGQATLRYDGLLATDAVGRTLAARFIQLGEDLAIMVDDAAASYPLTIDPWVQASEAKLTANGRLPSSYFGVSVALSQDGNTLFVGAYGANGRTGAVYIYTKGSAWADSSAPSATLTVSGGWVDDSLGVSVALSADGSTIVAGANGVSSNSGAAYVFTKDSAWADSSAPSASLTASDGVNSDHLGFAVALSDTAAPSSPARGASTAAPTTIQARPTPSLASPQATPT